MVDFNNETTVTQTPKQINIILLIEATENVHAALELYYKQYYNNVAPVCKPALMGLIRVLYGKLRPALLSDTKKNPETKKTIYETISDLLQKNDVEKYIKAFEEILIYLKEKGVTEFLSKRYYDPTDPEGEDQHHNL